MGERQAAGEAAPGPLGEQIMAALAAAALDRPAPLRTVEQFGVRMRGDEGVEPRAQGGIAEIGGAHA